MTWLVDTNIISEVRKGPRCHPGVAAWWAAVEDRDLFLSVLTLGEIRRGVEGVHPRDPAKAARIIGVDLAVAEAWGRMSVARSVPVIDALLAATAQVHDLVLVTRNMADVSGLGVRTLNPFDEAQT